MSVVSVTNMRYGGGLLIAQRLIALLRQPGNRTSTVSLGDRRDQGWKRAEAGDGRQR